ncbi:16S rRNA (cytidine(1402)-2'-O)-methyltransferase [Bacteroidota bacterium]
MSKLYIVPTPIGNLSDITIRAIEVLKQSDLILAEDTRKSSILLKHYSINSPMQSFHKFNEHKTVKKIAERIKAGTIMSLISDAGTPSISDPGYLLVKECVTIGIDIDCLPGATSLIPALVNSGFASDRFYFEGFLPHKKGRQKIISELSEQSRTMIFFESPHRLLKTLKQFTEFFGEGRNVSVSREITKVYEETRRGTLLEVISYYNDKTIKGEIVIVVEGKKNKKS